MWDKLTLGCLGLWAILFGLSAVTSIQIEWSKPIMGFAALVLGIVCLIRVFK